MKTKDEWLDDMELRLKRALLDVFDSNEDDGRRFLREEVASHLEDVSSDRARFDYLLSLRQRFPKIAIGDADNKVTEPIFQEPVTTTPEEALEIVRENWEKLDAASRETFLSRIGVSDPIETPEVRDTPQVSDSQSVAQQPGAQSEPSDDLARFLKLNNETPIDLDRLQAACVSLLKTVAQVDSLATQVYKQVGLSRDLKAEDIRKLVGEYVSGGTIEAHGLNLVLDEARMKVGLIINSVAGLPSTLAQTHFSKFQPSVIEQTVGGGGLLAGKDAKCWKKYVTLAEDIQPIKVEKAVNDLIIRQLKKLKKR